MPSDELKLIDALQELQANYGAVLTYDKLWRLVTSGRVAAQRRGQRWIVSRAQLSTIAEALGISTATVV